MSFSEYTVEKKLRQSELNRNNLSIAGYANQPNIF